MHPSTRGGVGGYKRDCSRGASLHFLRALVLRLVRYTTREYCEFAINLRSPPYSLDAPSIKSSLILYPSGHSPSQSSHHNPSVAPSQTHDDHPITHQSFCARLCLSSLTHPFSPGLPDATSTRDAYQLFYNPHIRTILLLLSSEGPLRGSSTPLKYIRTLQASRASDFSTARFRFLKRLLLVHGRYAYKRSSAITLYSFYRSFFICTIQAPR